MSQIDINTIDLGKLTLDQCVVLLVKIRDNPVLMDMFMNLDMFTNLIPPQEETPNPELRIEERNKK